MSVAPSRRSSSPCSSCTWTPLTTWTSSGSCHVGSTEVILSDLSDYLLYICVMMSPRMEGILDIPHICTSFDGNRSVIFIRDNFHSESGR